jgi:hypothetical protein
VQQASFRVEFGDRAHGGDQVLRGNVGGAGRFQGLDHDIRDRRVRAQQRVALLPFLLGQAQVAVLHLARLAGNDARLAQPAVSGAAAVAEAQARLQPCLKDRIVAFDKKVVTARSYGHLR